MIDHLIRFQYFQRGNRLFCSVSAWSFRVRYLQKYSSQSVIRADDQPVPSLLQNVLRNGGIFRTGDSCKGFRFYKRRTVLFSQEGFRSVIIHTAKRQSQSGNAHNNNDRPCEYSRRKTWTFPFCFRSVLCPGRFHLRCLVFAAVIYAFVLIIGSPVCRNRDPVRSLHRFLPSDCFHQKILH